ncbi:hypothetical protein FRC06_005771 [Ceratobasidium sp. 370]|nr:hypothetical protein FRC06_005771 [Ceratobasidium sp. 370]
MLGAPFRRLAWKQAVICPGRPQARFQPNHTRTCSVESSAHAATHPKSEDPNRSDLKTAAAHPVEAAKQARRGSSSSSSSDEGGDETGEPRRRTSIKDKITGAVKLATGKVKKDEAMIAEGQALRGH